MTRARKHPDSEQGEQRSLTTFFSMRDVGYLVLTGIMVASAFFTFESRVSILEHTEQVNKATIEKIKEDDAKILELGADIKILIADIVAKENRLILDVQKIERRLHEIEVNGGR